MTFSSLSRNAMVTLSKKKISREFLHNPDTDWLWYGAKNFEWISWRWKKIPPYPLTHEDKHKWGLITSNKCAFCDAKDTVPHRFSTCPAAATFIKSIAALRSTGGTSSFPTATCAPWFSKVGIYDSLPTRINTKKVLWSSSQDPVWIWTDGSSISSGPVRDSA